MSRRKRRRSSPDVADKAASNAGIRPAHAAPPRRVWLGWTASLFLAGAAITACSAWAFAPPRAAAPVYGYRVVNAYPHDAQAFTQGLAVEDGVLYEGTGGYGQSQLRRVDLKTGGVLKSVPLDRRYFGEGIMLWGDRIVQLTWREKVAVVYDKNSFQPLGNFRYDGEGWGVTHDGANIILSDGSSNLRFLDPQTFKVVRTLPVRDQGRRVDQLNELEYIQGEIWANVWHQDYLVRINPETGAVNSYVDLRGLLPKRPHKEAVLNGIAYDATNKRLYVTGKHWPKLFEIELVEPQP